MERNEFLLSSMSVLGSFLRFLILVLTLLTGAFFASLLKVSMLGYVAMDVVPPYWTA
jgi:hypothetical protein